MSEMTVYIHHKGYKWTENEGKKLYTIETLKTSINVYEYDIENLKDRVICYLFDRVLSDKRSKLPRSVCPSCFRKTLTNQGRWVCETCDWESYGDFKPGKIHMHLTKLTSLLTNDDISDDLILTKKPLEPDLTKDTQLNLVFITFFPSVWAHRFSNDVTKIRRLFGDVLPSFFPEQDKESEIDTLEDARLFTNMRDIIHCIKSTEFTIVEDDYENTDKERMPSPSPQSSSSSIPVIQLQQEQIEADEKMALELGLGLEQPNQLSSSSSSSSSVQEDIIDNSVSKKIGDITIEMRLKQYQLPPTKSIHLLNLFHSFHTSKTHGNGIQKINFYETPSTFMVRMARGFVSTGKLQGGKSPKWSLLYVFEDDSYAWVSITSSYKIIINMTFISILQYKRSDEILDHINDKIKILNRDVITQIAKEIVSVSQTNTNNMLIGESSGVSTDISFSIRDATIKTVSFKSNVSYIPDVISNYFKESNKYKSFSYKKNGFTVNDIIFFTDGKGDDYKKILDFSEKFKRSNQNIDDYLSMNKEKRHSLFSDIFKNKITPMSYKYMKGVVHVYKTIFYSTITFYNNKIVSLISILKELSNVYEYIGLNNGYGIIENSHLSKFFPMYTNMKTQNTNNDKIASITSQTGFSYIPHDLQDTPALVEKREFMKYMYSDNYSTYRKHYIIPSSSKTVYTISMFVFESLGKYLDDPENKSLLFHDTNRHIDEYYDKQYKEVKEKNKYTELENVKLSISKVISIIWKTKKRKKGKVYDKTQLDSIISYYRTARVIYKITRLILIPPPGGINDGLTVSELNIFKSWLQSNDTTRDDYLNGDFFWVSPHAYTAKDVNGEWKYIMGRVVRKTTKYYPIILLYFTISVYIRTLKKVSIKPFNYLSGDITDEETDLITNGLIKKLLTKLKLGLGKKSEKNITLAYTLLRCVQMKLYKETMKSGIYNSYTNVRSDKDLYDLFKLFKLKEGDFKEYKHEECENTLMDVLDYIKTNNKLYIPEFSYIKRNKGLFEKLETNSKLLKLFSYKETLREKGGRNHIKDGVVHDLMFHDFIGFLKPYTNAKQKNQNKQTPDTSPPLRHTIFSYSSTSDTSHKDILTRFEILSIVKLSPDKISSKTLQYEVFKTTSSRHPFRYHQINDKNTALLTLLSNPDPVPNDFVHYIVPTEKSNCQLLDLILYNAFGYESNVTNREMFVERLKEKKRDDIDTILLSINGGSFASDVMDVFPGISPFDILIKQILDDLEIKKDLVWTLTSIPNMVKEGVTYDIFYFKQMDDMLDMVVYPYYHPDTYNKSHTPILMFDTNQSDIMYSIHRLKKDSSNKIEKTTLHTETKKTIYKWLGGKYPNTEPVTPVFNSYSKYLSSFPPRYYDYSVKSIQNKGKWGYKSITKVIDTTNQTLYIIVTSGDANTILLPVIPHVCHDPKWKKKSVNEIDLYIPGYDRAIGTLGLLSDRFKLDMYSPQKIIVDSQRNVVGIVCNHQLVLPCREVKYNPEIHTYPVSDQDLRYNTFSTNINKKNIISTKTITVERMREYYYNKILYHMSIDPCVLFRLGIESEFLNNHDISLFKHKCKDDESGIGVYSESESELITSDYNRYDTLLSVPNTYKDWINSRILYEMVSGSLPWLLNKNISSIRNKNKLFEMDHEQIFIYHKQ
jgi:hypothetical protein